MWREVESESVLQPFLSSLPIRRIRISQAVATLDTADRLALLGLKLGLGS